MTEQKVADLRALGRLAHAWRRRPPSEMRVIAHRGCRSSYPENTRSAFAASLGCSHMIELDVRLSSDAAVVVFHDDTLERCSNAAALAPELGIDTCKVDQWRLDQLRLLDLGTWFSPYPHSDNLVSGRATSMPAYRPLTRELMPTLAETLAWARAYQMPLNVELKDQGSTAKNAILVQRVVQSIVAADCTALVLFSSFNYTILQECLRLAPFISRALLHGSPAPPDLLKLLDSIAAYACHPEHRGVDAALVRHLHQHGYAVHVWTVNERQRWQELQQCGVNALITDYPCLGAVPRRARPGAI